MRTAQPTSYHRLGVWLTADVAVCVCLWRRLCLARIASTLTTMEQRLKLAEVAYTEEDAAWLVPSDVFKKADEIASLWRKIKLLDAHFTKYDAVLRQQIREQTRQLEFAERSKTLLALVGDTRLEEGTAAGGEGPPALVHHRWHDERQRVFDELILDQRTKEGAFIHDLATLVNKRGGAPQTPSSGSPGTDPESIKATIQHLVEVMARDHSLESEQQQATLRLYVHRSIFPLIADSCFRCATEDETSDEEYIRYKDTVFRKQLQLLLPKDQAQVGVPPKFCRPPSDADSLFDDEEEQPYGEACAILRELTYLVVPSDMLFCLWRAGRAIYAMAEGYAAAHDERAGKAAKKRAEGIGADDFVPIFLYVTIHAQLPTPFQVCSCIKRFASDTERNSEAGYYLTCAPHRPALPPPLYHTRASGPPADPRFLSAHAGASRARWCTSPTPTTIRRAMLRPAWQSGRGAEAGRRQG